MTLIAFWHHLRSMPEFWGFVSIPLVAAIVTWAHVWLAMKMVFYPIEFLGYQPLWLGWQGIIPRKAGKMAGIIVDNALEKLGSVEEFFKESQPEAVAAYIANYLMDHAEEIADEIMTQHSPVLWENLPTDIRKMVIASIRRHAPATARNILKELEDNVSDYIDLREMVVRRMNGDRALVVRIFQQVGATEIAFIVNSSFWIGMFFGVIQMFCWYFFPYSWGLPVYGAALGYLTNWVALTLVFEPVNPIHLRIGPWHWTIQGLFLRRQNEVSEMFATITAMEVLSITNFMNEMFHGPRSPKTRALIRRHMRPLLEGVMVRSAALLTMGARAYADLKLSLADTVVDVSLRPLSDPALNMTHGYLLQQTLASRMKQMSSRAFQGLLRPAFQEDEWILIALGAVFGMLAGWTQWLIGFH